MTRPLGALPLALLFLACGGTPRSAAPSLRPTKAEASAPLFRPPPPEDTGGAAPRLQTTVKHAGRSPLFGARFTHTGRHLLVQDGDVQVFAFDPPTGALTKRGAFGFADDVDTASCDLPPVAPEVELWAPSSVMPQTLRSFDLSPDDAWVVGGAVDGAVGLWKLSPDAEPPASRAATLRRDFREVDVVAFARGASRVLVAGLASLPHEADGKKEAATALVLYAFEPARGGALRELGRRWLGFRPETHLEAIDVAPDGSLAAIVGQNGFFRLFSVSDALAEAGRITVDESLDDARFTPDGRALVTVGTDQSVGVWDVTPAAPRVRLHHVLRHPASGTWHVRIAADGRWMAVASQANDVSLWPLQGLRDDAVPTPTVFRPYADEISHALAIHPSWPWLVTGRVDLDVWRVNRALIAAGAPLKPRVTRALPPLPWPGAEPVLAAFLPSGDLLTVDGNGQVASFRDGRARVLRAASAGPKPAALDRDALRVKSATIVRDRLGLGQDGHLLVVSVDGAGEHDAGEAHPTGVAALAAAGDCVMSGGKDGGARTWKRDGDALAPAGSLATGGDEVHAVALAPNGRLAVTSASRRTSAGRVTSFRVHRLDPTSCAPAQGAPVDVFAPPTPVGTEGSRFSTPDGQETPVTLAFSPDGAWLLTGAESGGSATLWQVHEDTLTRAAFLEGHVAGVFAVAFSPSGGYALTAGRSGTTILWRLDGRGGAEQVEYLPPGGNPPASYPRTIAWSSDGARACEGGGFGQSGRMWCRAVAP